MKAEIYPKAPITEAVIDLRVREQVSFDRMERLADKLSRYYPVKEQMQDFELEIDGLTQRVDLKQSTISGFRLSSSDRADICVLNKNGLTTSRLAPYPGWNVIRDFAKRNWSEWRKVCGDKTPSRIGVRYINRIDIPLGSTENIVSDDYLRLVVAIPEIAPNPVSGFAGQVRMQTDLKHWWVLLNGGRISRSPLVNHISLLLDIDVYRDAEIPSTPKKLWTVIDEARGLKNRIFELMITDKARQLFR